MNRHHPFPQETKGNCNILVISLYSASTFINLALFKLSENYPICMHQLFSAKTLTQQCILRHMYFYLLVTPISITTLHYPRLKWKIFSSLNIFFHSMDSQAPRNGVVGIKCNCRFSIQREYHSKCTQLRNLCSAVSIHYQPSQMFASHLIKVIVNKLPQLEKSFPPPKNPSLFFFLSQKWKLNTHWSYNLCKLNLYILRLIKDFHHFKRANHKANGKN